MAEQHMILTFDMAPIQEQLRKVQDAIAGAQAEMARAFALPGIDIDYAKVDAMREAMMQVLRRHGYEIPGVADLCAIAALRAGNAYDSGKPVVETSTGPMSKCGKCGARYPSAPAGTLHKCGACSGGICQREIPNTAPQYVAK